MKLFIKNKLVSLGGSSTVTNENGEDVFIVEGKAFSPTKKKLIYDKNHNLLYIVRNRWFNFFADKVFVFDNENNKLATIKKGKFSFNHKFAIEDCDDEMSIDGKFFSRTSQIMRNGEVAGVITRDVTIINDAFILEADEKDIPFLTAIVIAFDNIKDKMQNKHD